MKRNDIPKYVQKLVERRTQLARQLCSVSVQVDEYCEKIGLDYNHPLFNDACLCTDVRIYCEADGAKNMTLSTIEKVLAERKDGAK